MPTRPFQEGERIWKGSVYRLHQRLRNFLWCLDHGADERMWLPQGHLIDNAVDISTGAGRLTIQDVRSDSLTTSKASSRVTSLGGQYFLNSFGPSGVEYLEFSPRANVSMTPYT